MLLVVRSMNQLRFEELARLYGCDRRQEADLFDYLQQVFFRTEGALYCLWQVDGVYRCALRLEPYEDGLLLTGLETPPTHRRKGYATALLTQTLQYLQKQGPVTIYSHIYHCNKASVSLHLRCGFRMMKDCAAFLDGSVSAMAGTYRFTSGASL